MEGMVDGRSVPSGESSGPRKKQQGFREDLETAWRDQDIGTEARRWDLASSSDSRMASRFRTKAGQSQQYAQINFQIDA
jgi:hypothetical protein